MNRNDSNNRTTAGVIAATTIIASVALLALAGLCGVSCAAEGETAGGIEGEVAGAAISAASVTTSINYQGRLADSRGSPLTGTYAITFRLYSVSTRGKVLATDTHKVVVADGLFNTAIDFGTSDFDGGELWLGVAVGADSEMTPRQELRTVPFAIKAIDADTIKGYGAGDFIRKGQPNVITSAMIVDSTITYKDLAANSVGSSEIATNAVRADEIRWSLNHQDSDLNGGLISLENTADGTSGNYPAGVLGQASGSPGSHRVIGVMGLAPPLGSGSTVGMLPSASKFGVVGVADAGYGVAGVSTSHHHAAVYGENTKGWGVYGKHTDPKYTSPGVKGENTGSGCGVLGDGGSGAGVICRSTSGNLLEAWDRSPSTRRFYVSNSGQVYADGAFHSGGADVAEYFPTPEDPEPGTVMVIDPAGGSKLRSSTNAYDTTVAGIVSTAPGVSLGTKEDGNDGEKLIAVAGRVPCKVDASYAPIMPGDLLTTSDTQGHAMKATNPVIGTILGKALEPLDAGTGTIEVLVTLQ